MSYSTLATASVSLALLAIALAVAWAILRCLRQRRWADRALTLMLVLLAGGAACSFFAGVESRDDLQTQARRVISLAASAEQVALARSGRYTTSVAGLWRLSPALAADMRVDGARVTLARGSRDGSVRLRVTLGYGSLTRLTLRPGARLNRLAGPRAASPRSAGSSAE
jgi:multisubunit Na+/H+ antiporter MnhF subunit